MPPSFGEPGADRKRCPDQPITGVDAHQLGGRIDVEARQRPHRPPSPGLREPGSAAPSISASATPEDRQFDVGDDYLEQLEREPRARWRERVAGSGKHEQFFLAFCRNKLTPMAVIKGVFGSRRVAHGAVSQELDEHAHRRGRRLPDDDHNTEER